jgi:hypothetical protein
MVVNNKETLKLLKTNYNLHLKLYKLNILDTMGGFLTKIIKKIWRMSINEIQFTNIKNT